MPPPKHPPDDIDPASSPEPITPVTPRRASVAKRKASNVPATPTNRKASAGQTPKSASAAAGVEEGASGGRQRSGAQKPPPTLLGDFLLGRQSPARVAAVRQSTRRKSVDAAAVRAELRVEMRQASVQRLQNPGGVRDRVKTWQKANASAMA